MTNKISTKLLVAGALLATITISTAAQAALHCVNVRGRIQACADAKPFKKLTIGIGIRFNKKPPSLSANPSTPPPPPPPRTRKLRR